MRVLLNPRLNYCSVVYRNTFRASLRQYGSTKSSNPLRILFCGSEEFSIASLRALHKEHERNPELIASIDVVCKPAKRVGRGRTALREVPISKVARELSLPLHQVNTFTGWKPPTPQGEKINLIIAVSFGLLVPHRILSEAQYGGLNVHPSMLPDFRGPAPLHHTLLHGEERIGLTLQTLHPSKFDQGEVLAQSPYPGFSHGCSTVPDLLALVAPKGAEMLLQSLKDRLHVPPRRSLVFFGTGKPIGTLRHASKITPEDCHINWDTWGVEKILRTARVIGPLWNIFQIGVAGKIQDKRIIWEGGFSKHPGNSNDVVSTGRHSRIELYPDSQLVIVKTCDGHTLQINDVKVEGESRAKSWNVFKRCETEALPNEALKKLAVCLGTLR